MTRSDIIDFVLLSAIWGVSFLFMRIAVPEFGPFALIGIRCGLAAICLLPLVLMREGSAQSKPASETRSPMARAEW